MSERSVGLEGPIRQYESLFNDNQMRLCTLKYGERYYKLQVIQSGVMCLVTLFDTDRYTNVSEYIHLALLEDEPVFEVFIHHLKELIDVQNQEAHQSEYYPPAPSLFNQGV